MPNKKATVDTKILEIIALITALFYLQSVLTVAHHTSMWLHDGTVRIVESPAVGALALSLGLCVYSCYKKRSASVLVIISLTILATASLFWLSGLRTNFYF